MSATRISYAQKVNEEHGPEQEPMHKTSAGSAQGRPRPQEYAGPVYKRRDACGQHNSPSVLRRLHHEVLGKYLEWGFILYQNNAFIFL